MACRRSFILVVILMLLAPSTRADDVPLGGFIPFVGIGLTDKFETVEEDITFFLAEKEDSYSGTALGSGYSDIALLDTGAATHILTQTAAGSAGFNIQVEGFGGANYQEIFGATGGSVSMLINDPLGVFAAGLGDRETAGPSLVMDPNDMVGQSNIAVLEAGADWELPNILGLPMAAQHGIMIRNDQPQIFEYQGRTMRTPQVEFLPLGTGDQQGIVRRTALNLEPSGSFNSGPLYVYDFNIDPQNPNLDFHDNPISPTIVENGGLYLEVDVVNKGSSNQSFEFLFDTGADMTVISETTALDFGIDVVLDEPDFLIEVEGAGGVAGGVPGYYLDEMEIDAIGGSLVLENVPVVVLNVPNPLSSANIIDGILGMHVFAGRNLVIDAAPAALIPGAAPFLYISDPVTTAHQWATASASGNWATGGNWAAAGVPGELWVAEASNLSGSDQSATVNSDSTVFEVMVSGTPTARMTIDVQSSAALTTFGQALIETGGEIHLEGGKLDAQVVNISGGTLSGHGEVFVGTGPVDGVVRNLDGRIAPDGLLTITGDLSNLDGTQIDFELSASDSPHIDVSRNAFLGGTMVVTVEDGFTPSPGEEFTLLSYGDILDFDFAKVALPLGYVWDLSVDTGSQSVVLEVLASSSLPGDFDANGIVDTDDLIPWKAGYGFGGISGLDFLIWQQNFGAVALGAVSTVPEPSAGLLAMLSFGMIGYRFRGSLRR